MNDFLCIYPKKYFLLSRMNDYRASCLLTDAIISNKNKKGFAGFYTFFRFMGLNASEADEHGLEGSNAPPVETLEDNKPVTDVGNESQNQNGNCNREEKGGSVD
ncbi:uncharacterized protein A4U43_C03F21110 [Asparagus officinalis]|uniref:Uncharacterized protein n=1 Tax=Asparagus officinalis TaxID=4686 RepID=A0A5P1FGX6_ASPOF|nr:uncharacterized protein A4U43_C03F21110 [Asparagus officinalis]